MDATAASSTLAPWQIVKRTSEKRVRAFQYMTSLHKGDSHFFNTVKITFDDLAMHYSAGKTKKRSAQWFHLGVSLAPLLQISDPVDYIRSLTLLMEEYEYEVSDYARQKMRQIFRKNNEEDEFTPSATFAESGLYTHYQTPNIPYELDYFQVVYSLCDLLVIVYQELNNRTAPNATTTMAYAEAFLRLDSRFRKIIAVMTKEINAIAVGIIKSETALIDSLFNSGDRSAPMFEADDGNVSS